MLLFQITTHLEEISRAKKKTARIIKTDENKRGVLSIKKNLADGKTLGADIN